MIILKPAWHLLRCPDCKWNYYIQLAVDETMVECPHCRKMHSRFALTQLREFIGGLHELDEQQAARAERLALSRSFARAAVECERIADEIRHG